MQNYNLAFLRLLQLADSAIPIGTTAHSFGLETLVAERCLTVGQLEEFLKDYLVEAGQFEAIFCREGYRLATSLEFREKWLMRNQQLSAFKVARENRAASATLGRRFLQLALELTGEPRLRQAAEISKQHSVDIHYNLAFGLVGSVLGMAEEIIVLAYLQQVITGLVSACQRLLPLGQMQAGRILWALKPVIVAVAEQSYHGSPESVEFNCFTGLIDLAGMCHPLLATRLFIS